MKAQLVPTKERLQFTLMAVLFVSALLSVEFFTDGVVTHNLLASEDLPGISNWWGLLSLPLLAYLLFPRSDAEQSSLAVFGFSSKTAIRFVVAIIYGASMAASFEFSYDQTTEIFLLMLFVIGVFLPLYRSEFVVGFVIGMSYTFGAVIPIGVAALVALSSSVLHSTVRFVISKLRLR